MIERLYVNNFRCLDNFTLNLTNKRSVVLIGANGAGKSTVLTCLRLFQGIGRGFDRVRQLISADDFSQNRMDRPIRLEIEVRLAGRRLEYAVSFEWPPNFHEARILDESLSADGAEIYSRRQAQVQLSGGAGFGLDWHIFALSVVNEPAERRDIRDLKAFFASMVLTAPIPADMGAFSEEPSHHLLFHAENFASCLRALIEQKPAAYGRFDSYLREVVPDFSSIENVPRGEKGTSLVVKFENPETNRSFTVGFDKLSDGEKCFFLSAYVVAARAAGLVAVCAWDEPDNHLSLSEVGRFITGLRKATNQGGQFLATTHHPETIRKFSDETTYVLARKSPLDPVVCRPLSELEYGGDLVNALIRGQLIEQP